MTTLDARRTTRLTALAMPAAMRAAQLALDRAGVLRRDVMALDRSLRSYDEDGRLRVVATNISKAAVNPYLGRTIPDCARLGLDPDRVYMLFRDPRELARAASTFNGLPLLDRHAAATAADHRPDLVVGSTGTDCAFVDPFLQVSLVIWAGDSIARVNDGSQRELSAAYRYTAIPEPGSYLGRRYDLKMTDIRGSHVALVQEGRAGPDVLVADQAFQKGTTMANSKPARPPGLSARDDDPEIDPGTVSQLLSYLGDVLSPDQIDDVTAILNGQSIAAPSTMAGDSAQDIARRAVADQRAQQQRDMQRRFPDINRLHR